MTIKDKKYLSDEIINELDSAFFDNYHENVCEEAIENFRRDGEITTILVGHTKGAASFTKLLNREISDEAVILMQELKNRSISTYSFISEGKVQKKKNGKKLDCFIISSHNKAGDSRTTIYQITNREERKTVMFATGEVQDNFWNYLLTNEERVLH